MALTLKETNKLIAQGLDIAVINYLAGSGMDYKTFRKCLNHMNDEQIQKLAMADLNVCVGFTFDQAFYCLSRLAPAQISNYLVAGNTPDGIVKIVKTLKFKDGCGRMGDAFTKGPAPLDNTSIAKNPVGNVINETFRGIGKVIGWGLKKASK